MAAIVILMVVLVAVVVASGVAAGMVVRRLHSVTEMRGFADGLVDSAMADPKRVLAVTDLGVVVQRAEVMAELRRVAIEAKTKFNTDHAEIGMLVADGDVFLAGDTLVPVDGPRANSYVRLTLAGLPVVVEDTFAHPMLAANPYARSARSYVGVPIRLHDEVVGALSIYNSSPRSWTDEEAEEMVKLGKYLSVYLGSRDRRAS